MDVETNNKLLLPLCFCSPTLISVTLRTRAPDFDSSSGSLYARMFVIILEKNLLYISTELSLLYITFGICLSTTED